MSITAGKNYVALLDEIYKATNLTSVLDGSSDLVKEGANPGELVVGKLSMDGQGTYSRANGFVNGSVNLEWETIAADYDRGRKFNIDVVDNEDTFNLILGKIAGEYIRTKVNPELDAFRIAKYAGTTGIGSSTDTITTGAGAIAAIRNAIDTMDDAEVSAEGRVLFATPTVLGLIADLDTTKSKEVMDRFSDIVRIPQSRMYTAIDLYSGTSTESAGGYVKNTSAANINFMIIAKDAVTQFEKHATPKIIAPEYNNDADAYIFGYRLVSCARVLDNKKAGVFCSHA